MSKLCVVGVPCNLNIELPAALILREDASQITEEEICKKVAGP